MKSPVGGKGTLTIVIQTRVRPEAADAFSAWQAGTAGARVLLWLIENFRPRKTGR
jgi:hypothetical protein